MKFFRYILLFFLMFLITQTGNSQSKTLPFSERNVVKFDNGNYIKINCFDNKQKNKENICCEKYKVGEFIISRNNKRNREIWKKKISINNCYIDFKQIKKDSRSNTYVLGSFFENTSLVSGFYVLKINKRGKFIWSKTFKLSEELSKTNSHNIMYICPNENLVVINKSPLKNNLNNLSQISLFKFDNNGDKKTEISIEVDNNIIGASIDQEGHVYFLGSNAEKEKMTIDFLVNLDEIVKEVQLVANNSFHLGNPEFNDNLQLIDTLELAEISFFSNLETKGKTSFSYFSTFDRKMLKCKIIDGNKANNENVFQDFDASLTDKKNLWADNRLLNSTNTNELIFHIKNCKKANNEFKYSPSKKEKLQKEKSETFTIQSLTNEIHKIILVKTLSLNIPEYLEE